MSRLPIWLRTVTWMTCRVEVKLLPKLLALDLFSLTRGEQVPWDCWVLRQRAAYPSCKQSWYFEEYALTCLTCVSILADFSSQVITHLWHCFAFLWQKWTLPSYEKRPKGLSTTWTRNKKRRLPALHSQRNWSFWLMKIFVISDSLTDWIETTL